jgi:hypothetical protein
MDKVPMTVVALTELQTAVVHALPPVPIRPLMALAPALAIIGLRNYVISAMWC